MTHDGVRRYVCGFFFRGTDVLLIKKARPKWMEGARNGLGGKIHDGEEPRDAMAREFAEECGVRTSPQFWFHFATLYGADPEGAPFEVIFFRSDVATAGLSADEQDKIRLHQGQEPCSWIPLQPVLMPGIKVGRFVSNVPWLVAMADMAHKHDWPYEVHEKAGRV